MSAPFVVRARARGERDRAVRREDVVRDARARSRAYPRGARARGAATTRDVASGASGRRCERIFVAKRRRRGVDASSKARETRERRAGEPVADGGFG